MGPLKTPNSLHREIAFTIIFDAVTQTDDACPDGFLATESNGD
jgi:hypothetical protein